MKKFNRFINEHRKMFSFGIIILSIILIGLPLIITNSSMVSKTASKVENMYYLSQIISSFFVIAGVVIAGWQYFLTSKMEIQQIKIGQVQKAIDLAEYYKDNILENYGSIYYVYEEAGILDILNNIQKENIVNFDTIEANKLYGINF